MKFVYKIAAASSGLLLFTIAVLNTFQYLKIESELNYTIEESITDIVQGVGNIVASELSGKMALAKYTTALTTNESSKEYITHVISQKDIKNSFLLVGGGFESDGSYFKNDPNWNPGNGWDPRVRPWYIDAKTKNDTIITAPYADSATGEILISIGTPMIQDGSFLGAVFFDLSLSGLSELVNSVKLFNAGYLFIVTDAGTVIAHPDSKYNGKDMKMFLPNSIIGTEATSSVMIDDKEFNLRFSKVPEQNWYVGVLLDEKVAYQSIYNLRNDAIIYGIIAIIISIFVLRLLMNKLLLPLDALNDAIQDVASGNGDLTKRLNTNTDKEFSELASGFNTFAENLQSQIKQLKAYGIEVFQGAETMGKGASESAKAMSLQSQEVELLATAMNEMATTASDMAANAQNAALAAQDAESSTSIGSKVINETTLSIDILSNSIKQAVNDVNLLEEATGNIESVLQVINDIADQTNLLALNAAIEAARAGEQGRGFAVVADEVRTLASRTQESTTEIRTMIDKLQSGATTVSLAMNASQEAADGTVEQAKKTGDALTQIQDAIKRINDMNVQIASAAEEQSIVAEEMNTNTVKIKDLSVQVSNSAQEANVATNKQVQNLTNQNTILEKFKV